MEDQLKSAATNQQPDFNATDSGNDSSGSGDSPFSDHSESGTSGTSNSSHNLDLVSAIAGENSQTADTGKDSPRGWYEAAP